MKVNFLNFNGFDFSAMTFADLWEKKIKIHKGKCIAWVERK